MQELLPYIQRLCVDGYVIKQPKLTDNDTTITLEVDAYMDPCLTICILGEYDILTYRMVWAGTEIDRVIISAGKLDILQKLDEAGWPSYDKIEVLLKSWQIAIPEKSPSEQPDFIHLGHDLIPVADWQAYWALEGKTGPDSGWEIPTKEQLYQKLKP